MLQRTLTVIVAFPFLIAAIYFGGWWLTAVAVVLSLIGLYEIYNAVSQKILPLHLVGYVWVVPFLVFMQRITRPTTFLVFVAVFLLCVMLAVVIGYQKFTLTDCLVTVFGFMYVPVLFSFFILVRAHDEGLLYVWLIFAGASGSDTFAYLVGCKFGRHKLANSPSPKKSVEGCLGGIVGATLVGFVYGWVVTHFFDASDALWLNSVLICLVCSVVSQFGDLFASALKRATDRKDFGKLLPGHGGVLDRFDGILIAAPVVYMFMVYFA